MEEPSSAIPDESDHAGADAGPAAGGSSEGIARVAEGAEKTGRRTLPEAVHAWMPLAIVVVSVITAVAGLRASVSDEHATHTQELSREDLVQEQQQLVQDNSAVDSEIRLFGQFAQYSELANSLLNEADKVGGPMGDQMRTEGQADLGLALSDGGQIINQNYGFEPSNPFANSYAQANGTYAIGNPYNAREALEFAEGVDFQLHGLQPERLLKTALAQHDRGVYFTGIAALFVGVLVLLTLGALLKGTDTLWFAGSGAVLVAVGLSLFFIVQLS